MDKDLTVSAHAITKVYDEKLGKLFDEYCVQYEKSPKQYIQTVNNIRAAKIIVLGYYKKYVNQGLTPVEELLRTDKQDLVNEIGLQEDRDLYRMAYAMKHRNKQLHEKRV